jgi:regulator of sirC expression with transglutaminase-like and TPR domain
VRYLSRGDTNRAIEMSMKSLAVDSIQSQSAANLALIYLNKGESRLSVQYATDAITFGMNDPLIYRIRGKAYLNMDRYKEAVADLDRYLQAVPDDNSTKALRDRVLEQ